MARVRGDVACADSSFVPWWRTWQWWRGGQRLDCARVSWEGPTWAGRAPEGRSGSAGAVGRESMAPPRSRAEPRPAWAWRKWLTCGGVSQDPAAWGPLAPGRATFLCPEALQVLHGLLLYVLAGLRPGVWSLCPQNRVWSQDLCVFPSRASWCSRHCWVRRRLWAPHPALVSQQQGQFPPAPAHVWVLLSPWQPCPNGSH